jgi:hypothetical protein
MKKHIQWFFSLFPSKKKAQATPESGNLNALIAKLNLPPDFMDGADKERFDI